MIRFKYYTCERDLIYIASGHIEKARFFHRKPHRCPDEGCDVNIVALYLSTDHPIKDGKRKGDRKKLEGTRKKRSMARKGLSRNARNRHPGRSKNLRKKIITKR